MRKFKKLMSMLMVVAMVVTMMPQNLLTVLAGQIDEDIDVGMDVKMAETVEMSIEETDDVVVDAIEQKDHTNDTIAEQDISVEDSSSPSETTLEPKQFKSAGDIASGTDWNITWRIDADGKLTVEGEGDFDYSSNADRAPWYSQRESIKTAVVYVIGMENASHMFYNCSNLTSLDVSGFDTSSVTNMEAMFYGCSNLTSVDVSGFDTSSVTDMRDMFYGCSGLTSVDVSGFDTSSVIDMSYMFYGCSGLTSVDVSGFDTSNVISMYDIFRDCSSLDILYTPYNVKENMSVSLSNGKWQDAAGNIYATLPEKLDYSIMLEKGSKPETVQPKLIVTLLKKKYIKESKIEKEDMCVRYRSTDGTTRTLTEGYTLSDVDMSSLGEKNLTITYNDGSNDLNTTVELEVIENIPIASGSYENIKWEIDAVGKLTVEGTGEFSDRTSHSRAPWFGKSKSIKSAVVRVTGMKNASYMFEYCSSLKSLDVSGFDTSSVTNMYWMFYGCSSLKSLDVSGFDTSSVTNMDCMFYGCSSLKSLDVSGFDTSNVTDMSSMFWRCSNLKSLDVSGFDTSSVTNMTQMFGKCSSLTSLDVSKFDTSGVTSIWNMFCDCRNLTSLDVSGFDTSSVTNMTQMFSNCSSLTSLDVSKFDTSSVTDMFAMFRDCSSLKSLDVSSFDTSSVTSMDDMFRYCRGLTSLDLSGFDTSSVTSMSDMFQDCRGLTSLDLSGFDTSSVTYMSGMFFDCSSLSTVYTPYNVLATSFVYLPGARTDVWYDADGNTYEALPEGLDYSIILSKNTIPDAMQAKLTVRLAKSFYEKGSTIDTKDLTVVYRGTDGRSVILSPKGADDTVKGYTLSAVDMNISGEKIMTVSYNDGTNTLTETVRLTVVAPLDVIVTLPETNYIYNGKQHRPVPTVKSSAGGTEDPLILGKDYTVSYQNNVDAGNATVTVTGKNAFSGTVTGSFVIQKAPLTITALDINLVIGQFDALPNEDAITCKVIGLCGTHKAQDVFDIMPEVSYAVNGEKIDKSTIAVDREGNYNLIPFGAVLNKEAGANYEITSYQKGTLTIVEKSVTEPSESESESSKESESSSENLKESESSSESSEEFASESSKESESASESSNESESSSESSKESESSSESSKESEPSSESSNASESSTEPADSAGLHVTFPEGKIFTYTGSAIKPAIEVTNNGETLTEGTDYTVKYSNNTKAGTAKITVTGKGSFTGKQDTTFTIAPRSLLDDGIVANDITIAANSKAVPVVLYNGMKLSAKDYTLSNTGKITEDEVLTITGKGNYQDEITVNVKVVESLGKFKVNMNKDKLVYNGEEQRLGFEVIDSNTKEPLKEDEYMAVYSEDVTNAGTVKVTIIGLGTYGGSVTKSYKINPLKTDMELSFDKQKEYTFNRLGTTVDDISVKVKESGAELEYGRDYKISYSANKKAGTGKINVTFLGNYKGSKAVKDTFTIKPGVLDDSTVNVIVPDKAYTGKKNAYKSAPIVTDKSGNALKSSDYTATYYADYEMTKEIKGKENLIELEEGSNSATVYVKITGKGNYAGDTNAYARDEYNVERTTDSVLDLSKAKVTFKKEGIKVGKLEYTGNAIEPDVEVTVKVKGAGNITLDESQYDIKWTNNVNKGKATAVITGNGTEVNGYSFVGSKNATINITAGNLKNVRNLFDENVSKYIKIIF